MCGIAGIARFDTDSPFLGWIEKMTNVMRHRGPDDEGFALFRLGKDTVWQYGGKDTPESVYRANFDYTPKEPYSGQEREGATLALGHRRLSIIDLSAAGHQPMCTRDRRYWIVHNGEIYNYLELREELTQAGYLFQSCSDTEVLLNTYVRWGPQGLNRLVGMFAFALYDRKEERLFLARDFFGIKPLYYTVWPGGIAFSSEINALLCLPQVTRRVNPQRVYEYLRFGFIDHGDETLLADVRQLPAAHYMWVSLKREESLQPVRYWDINLKKRADISLDEAVIRVRELFLESVRLHLRSDVPIGSALSGGIDSSSIVMAMRYLNRQSMDLNTFSYVSGDPETNEEKWIDVVGEAASVSVNKVRLSSHELMADLDHLIFIQGEPFGGASIYAQHRVLRLASENGIKVMLDGQGADELLGGYRRYWGARLASLIRQFQWLRACRFFSSSTRQQGGQWSTILMQAGSYFLPSSLQLYALRLAGYDVAASWLQEEWFRDREVKATLDNKSHGKEILHEELRRSLTGQGLVSLLRYEDRNAMAFSIESRVPFLTIELSSLISSLPEEYIIHWNGTQKYVFREAMRGIVPDVILGRKDKIGFATPQQHWLYNLFPWIDSVLRGPTACEIPVLNIRTIENWQETIRRVSYFDSCLWRWINLIRWVEIFDVQFH